MSPHPPHRRHVLVAEDEPDIRELLVLLLEDEGVEVTAVANGQEAVTSADATPFDLAVLDVTMPVMDGLEAAKILRARDPGIRILFHTALDEGFVRSHFRAYDGYLRKPIDPDQLHGSLERLLA